MRAGSHHSHESRRKNSEAHKIPHPSPSPETREKISMALMGHLVTEEARVKMSAACKGKQKPPRSQEHCRRISESKMGHSVTEETRRKISAAAMGRVVPAMRGENHFNWNGGSSPDYCEKWRPEFRERVRAFWGYACGICGKSQKENGKRLHVHHVNYRKDACCNDNVPRQFIALCASCHSATNSHRARWEKKLGKLIEKKYGGRCYFHQKEQLAAWGAT